MARHKERLILFWKSFSIFAVSLTMAALYGCGGGGGGGSGSNDAADGAGLVAGDADIGGNLDVVGTGDFQDTLTVSPITQEDNPLTTVASDGGGAVIETNGTTTLNAAGVTGTIEYTATATRVVINNDPTDCDPNTAFCQDIGGSDVGNDGIYYGDIIQTISGVSGRYNEITGVFTPDDAGLVAGNADIGGTLNINPGNVSASTVSATNVNAYTVSASLRPS